MPQNEVILLKEENKNQSIELREDDMLVIKDIMKSMSMFKVNSYDAQVIQRDLIGMAQELKLRNSSLQEDIGDDVKGFANEIISNSNRPCIREVSLNFLLEISKSYFVCFALLSFFAYGSLSWKANPIIYFYYIGFAVITFVTEGMITPLFITEKGIKKNLGSLFSILLIVILTTMVFFLNDNHYTREVHGGYIILISGIVHIITRYLNKININRLAKGKKNYIADLK